jgi:hypothetical protein
MQRLAGPTVGDGEVFVHETSLVERVGRGKDSSVCAMDGASKRF